MYLGGGGRQRASKGAIWKESAERHRQSVMTERTTMPPGGPPEQLSGGMDAVLGSDSSATVRKVVLHKVVVSFYRTRLRSRTRPALDALYNLSIAHSQRLAGARRPLLRSRRTGCPHHADYLNHLQLHCERSDMP